MVLRGCDGACCLPAALPAVVEGWEALLWPLRCTCQPPSQRHQQAAQDEVEGLRHRSGTCINAAASALRRSSLDTSG